MKSKLNPSEKVELIAFTKAKLDEAEKIWQQIAPDLVEMAEDTSMRKVAKSLTQIPGYELIEDDINVVDDFVVIMADMRNSTKHLTTAISGTLKDASGLKRVFLETSILLPSMAKIVSFGKGRTLEYLGDGILAAYRVAKGQEKIIILDAHSTSEKIVECVVDIINPLIDSIYRLPPLSIGIGIARSQGIVRMVGIDGFLVPKIFGKSVFYASKLSVGDNTIYLDEMANGMWPTAKDGEKVYVRMKKVSLKSGDKIHDGYMVEYIQ